jgi:hypothetical protein
MSNQERPKPEQDPTTGRFLPGNTGNGGRRKGSKNAYAEAFWADLCEVWEAKGKQALEDAVTADPVRFVSVAAQVLPKDLNVKNEATDAFVNLWKLISDGTAEQAVAKARGEDDGAMEVRDVGA